MNPRPGNLQLMNERIGERHRDTQAHESSGADDTGNVREISRLPSGRIECLFEKRDQLMVADAVINRLGSFDGLILHASEKT